MCGVPGQLDPTGESGAEPVSTVRFLKLGLFFRTVMLRVIGTKSVPNEEEDDDRGVENESYLRSLPRPESGAGPARVSSHNL